MITMMMMMIMMLLALEADGRTPVAAN